jgi:hypothetical protein
MDRSENTTSQKEAGECCWDEAKERDIEGSMGEKEKN